MNKRSEELRFGTSGLRDTVLNMTDMECYINTKGFIAYLNDAGEFEKGGSIAVAGDRRPSTPRIKRAVAAAIRDSGGMVDDQGLVPSPALGFYAMELGIPSIMVTGSHIPADRNGIKFTKKAGEVLKSDEEGILVGVARCREEVYGTVAENSLFDENGMFKNDARLAVEMLLEDDEYRGKSAELYINRYTGVFGSSTFGDDTKIFLYQHSAVGRDIVKEIFELLGAKVIAPDTSVELDYEDERGERQREKALLRSPEFVSVDTESVSSKTMAVFTNVMNANDLDIGISLDGDSDRPLLAYRVYADGKPTDEVRYVTGDILGLLAVLGLEAIGVQLDAVCVPVSANDAVGTVLNAKNLEVTSTKIGSPYVIAAMNESLAKHSPKGSDWNVCSWESNGGFLTGSDLTIKGQQLKALPTRDAVLPLLAVIMMSRKLGVPVSLLLDELPARFTYADRKQEFPTSESKSIIGFISPVSEKDVKHVKFQLDGKVIVDYMNGETREVEPGSEFCSIRENLEAVFTDKHGFDGITDIDYTDGVRVVFLNGEISHLRPSGNAPEFRNYAIANTPDRAKEIVEAGINEIIPALALNVKK